MELKEKVKIVLPARQYRITNCMGSPNGYLEIVASKSAAGRSVSIGTMGSVWPWRR